MPRTANLNFLGHERRAVHVAAVVDAREGGFKLIEIGPVQPLDGQSFSPPALTRMKQLNAVGLGVGQIDAAGATKPVVDSGLLAQSRRPFRVQVRAKSRQ